MTTKPKARKAAAPLSRADCEEIEKRIKVEGEEERQAASDAFQTLFADWLAARADDERPRDTNDERGDRADELAMVVTTTPAPAYWVIWHKLEVLEHYLINFGEGTRWSDNREFVMLAGIKADLARFLP